MDEGTFTHIFCHCKGCARLWDLAYAWCEAKCNKLVSFCNNIVDARHFGHFGQEGRHASRHCSHNVVKNFVFTEMKRTGNDSFY